MELNPLLSKTKTFHSKQYLIELFLDSSKLKVKLKEDKAKGWFFGEFSIHFIETLTHKAGSSKKFNVFLNMLISAVEGTSSAVLIDFESHAELEKLRKKPLQGNSSNSYLILTYIAEFDKVYYPLPLSFTPSKDAADDLVFSKVKQENSCLTEENLRLKNELETNRLEKEGLKKDFESFKQAMNKEIQSLQGIVEELRNNLGRDQLKTECERLEFEKKVLESEIKSLKMLNKKRKLKINEMKKKIENKENCKERSKSLLGGESDVTKTCSRWKSSVRSSYNSEEISEKLEKIVSLLTVNERRSVFY